MPGNKNQGVQGMPGARNQECGAPSWHSTDQAVINGFNGQRLCVYNLPFVRDRWTSEFSVSDSSHLGTVFHPRPPQTSPRVEMTLENSSERCNIRN